MSYNDATETMRNKEKWPLDSLERRVSGISWYMYRT